jgi:hypothetical protein
MYYLARHEWIRIQQKQIKASLRTEINPFAMIVCTWIFGCIRYFPAAGSFEFCHWRKRCLILIQYYFPFLLRCWISLQSQNTVTTTATPAIPARITTLEVELNHILQIEANKMTPMTKAAM